MYQVGDAVGTTEGAAIVQQVYPDGDLALSFPDYTYPDEIFTMSPEDVSPVCASSKRQRSSAHLLQVVKRRKTHNDAYKKDRTPIVSKTEQNTAFLSHLRSLGLPMKNLHVLVLDTSMLRTTHMLLEAGLMPSHIYIPQPDGVEAARMLEQHPTLRVFAGFKAGDLIWHMADRGVRFHGTLMDYCGAAGRIGRKNMPVDDMANLFRYNLLADQAVMTQTVCARSCVKVTQKFESFKYLVKNIRNCSRIHGRRVHSAEELIYTDPGSQTMCHFRCILSKKGSE